MVVVVVNQNKCLLACVTYQYEQKVHFITFDFRFLFNRPLFSRNYSRLPDNPSPVLVLIVATNMNLWF